MGIGTHMHDPSPPSTGGAVAPGAGLAGSAFEGLEQRVVALEGALQRDGWTTVAAAAAQTAVVSQADTARTGIVHEVACDQGTSVVETLEDGAVVSSCAYQEQAEGALYELVLLLNPGVERAVLLPAVLDQGQMDACRSAVDEETDLYSVVVHPTAGRLGAVKHPAPDAFHRDSA